MKTLDEYDAVISTPFGGLGIKLQDSKLNEVEFIYHPVQETVNSTYAKSIATQFKEYFLDPRRSFDCKLEIQGTEFQQRVWESLRKIPLGQVRTYGDLAKELNSSARAVGNACRRNPVPLVVPCHRVVAKNGLGGFAGFTAGQTVNAKQWLLNFEAKYS